jgi:hypothetical protein
MPGPMDRNLEERYEALLEAYPTEQDDGLTLVKKYLLSQTTSLRPDGALCLLTLYDYMILRPYAGHVSVKGRPGELPLHRLGADRTEFMHRVGRSLDLISIRLRDISPPQARAVSGDPRASSHDVLRAIDIAWPELSILFGWG